MCWSGRPWRARAAEAGVVYSLAYGDQPALICELVDWARACGFEVVAAGKGTKHLPTYHASTPDTVWDHYGLTAAQAAAAGMNSQMFNTFLDGTKSAIEMARGGQRHRADPGAGRARRSRPAASTTCPSAAPGRRRRRAAPQGPGRGGLLAGARLPAGRSATCAGASTW